MSSRGSWCLGRNRHKANRAKHAARPAFLAVTALVLLAGCGRHAGEATNATEAPAPQQRTVRIVVQGDPKASAVLEELLKKNPTVFNPRLGIKYSIIVVEPHPGVDYKILKVTPDPNVDYKIRIVDPTSGKEIPQLSEQLADAILKRLQHQSEKQEQ